MIDKVWFKIGEAALQVGATPKELRYWEKVIPELQPRRSKGNLRYYHLDELPRLQSIRQWLTEGFTVSDCRALLQGAPVGSLQIETNSGYVMKQLPGPHHLQAVMHALRTLHARLGVAPGEEFLVKGHLDVPLPSVRKKKARAVSTRKIPLPSPPITGTLLLDPEAMIAATETPDSTDFIAMPKRISKPKPDPSTQDTLWSGGRLPLDAEE